MIYYFYYLEKYKHQIKYNLPENTINEYIQAIIKSFQIGHEDKTTLKLKLQILEANRENNSNILSFFSERGDNIATQKNNFMLRFSWIMNKYCDSRFLNNFLDKVLNVVENDEFSNIIIELFNSVCDNFDKYYSDFSKESNKIVKSRISEMESQITDLKSLITIFIKQSNDNKNSIQNNLNEIKEKLFEVSSYLFDLMQNNHIVSETFSFLEKNISFILLSFQYIISNDNKSPVVEWNYCDNLNNLLTYIIKVKEDQSQIKNFLSLSKQIILLVDQITNTFPKLISLSNCENILQFIHIVLYNKNKIDYLELSYILSILLVLVSHKNAEPKFCVFVDVFIKLLNVIITFENVFLDNKLNSKLNLLFKSICNGNLSFSSDQTQTQFKLIELMSFINTINFERTNPNIQAVLRGVLQIYVAFSKKESVKKILNNNFCNSSLLIDYCTNLLNFLEFYLT